MATNTSATYTLLVDRLKKETITKAANLGIMKNLVTMHTETGGNDLSWPVFDHTTAAATASSVGEGVSYSTVSLVKDTKWSIGTPTKYIVISDLTDEARKLYSSEALYQHHADLHAFKQMLKLEKGLVGNFASFTSTVSASGTSGLTLAKLADGVTALEAKAYDLVRPYSFVGVANVYNYLWKDMGQQGVSSSFGPVGPIADKAMSNYFVSAPMPGVVNYFNTIPGAISATAATVCGLFTKDAIKAWSPLMFEMETERKYATASEYYYSRSYWVTRPFRAEAGVKYTCKGN